MPHVLQQGEVEADLVEGHPILDEAGEAGPWCTPGSSGRRDSCTPDPAPTLTTDVAQEIPRASPAGPAESDCTFPTRRTAGKACGTDGAPLGVHRPHAAANANHHRQCQPPPRRPRQPATGVGVGLGRSRRGCSLWAGCPCPLVWAAAASARRARRVASRPRRVGVRSSRRGNSRIPRDDF
eukprot:scaffold36975_cov63-Phaeocystis_antarctica.AAC.3